MTARDAAILVALGEGVEDEIASSLTSAETHSKEEEQSAGSGVRFFDLVAKDRDGKIVANWCVILRSAYCMTTDGWYRIINELLGGLAKARISFAASPIVPEELGGLIDSVTKRRITGQLIILLNRSWTDPRICSD